MLTGFYLGIALFVALAVITEASLDEQIRTLGISIVAGVFVALAVALFRGWERKRASGQHEVQRKIDLGQSDPRPLPHREADEAPSAPKKRRARGNRG
jgi:hypothetical protein